MLDVGRQTVFASPATTCASSSHLLVTHSVTPAVFLHWVALARPSGGSVCMMALDSAVQVSVVGPD
jgi:hypothetical protein